MYTCISAPTLNAFFTMHIITIHIYVILQINYKSTCVVDPTLTEEECARNRAGSASGHMTVVYLPSLDEVSAINQSGCMQQDELMMVHVYTCMTVRATLNATLHTRTHTHTRTIGSGCKHRRLFKTAPKNEGRSMLLTIKNHDHTLTQSPYRHQTLTVLCRTHAQFKMDYYLLHECSWYHVALSSVSELVSVEDD